MRIRIPKHTVVRVHNCISSAFFARSGARGAFSGEIYVEDEWNVESSPLYKVVSGWWVHMW